MTLLAPVTGTLSVPSRIQKQIKSINLDAIKSDSKEKQQAPSKNADDASDVHLWRKGTTLIAGDSILYGIDVKKDMSEWLSKG